MYDFKVDFKKTFWAPSDVNKSITNIWILINTIPKLWSHTVDYINIYKVKYYTHCIACHIYMYSFTCSSACPCKYYKPYIIAWKLLNQFLYFNVNNFSRTWTFCSSSLVKMFNFWLKNISAYVSVLILLVPVGNLRNWIDFPSNGT